MKYVNKNKLLMITVSIFLCFSTIFSLFHSNLNSNVKTSQASFKCLEGYIYYAGSTGDKNKPLPHNCTKVDDMVMVCENDYVPNPNDNNKCIRDLVMYPCPLTPTADDFVIHKSVSNKQPVVNTGSGGFFGIINQFKNNLDGQISDSQKKIEELTKYKNANSTSNQMSSIDSKYINLTKEQIDAAAIALKTNQDALDKLNLVKGNLATQTENTFDGFINSNANSNRSFMNTITNFKNQSIIQDFRTRGFGDLCTKYKDKDNFSVGNVCNKGGAFGTGNQENYSYQNFGLFSTVNTANITLNGISLPDKDGLVSYFNEQAYKVDEKDYGKFKADLFDLLNNDNSPYASQLCGIKTKALKSKITFETKGNGCWFGIDCQTFTKITEAVSEVADSCDLAKRTCVVKLKCIRSIHKCEPVYPATNYPIEQFNYYIGKESKDGNGKDTSNGRAVQFEPDYENLPNERTYLPNTGHTTICPANTSDISWRPLFVGVKTDFHIFDTELLEDKHEFTPFLCVKKGFDLKSEYIILRDNDYPDCGARSLIYGDTASSDDSALIICTPPLTSGIKVPVCPGGTSIKVLGDYTNIEGGKCYKSIAPEEFVVDETVIGEPRCTPGTIKPKSELNCVFNLSKDNFAGYGNFFDLAKLVSDPKYQLPTDSKYESCKPLLPLSKDADKDAIKVRNDEIYLNKITCAALTTTVSSQKFSGHFVLDKDAKVKIKNIDGTNLAMSDNCKIPFTKNNDKIEYENLLVCENINIGESFEEGSKNIIIQIGDFNYEKGKIEAKLGGCADGVADIYDCYQCVSGQIYTPGKACFQPGQSGATKESPSSGNANSLAPNIPLNYSTIQDGTPATLLYEGSKNPVKGTIVNGGFVPNNDEIIPADAKTGATIAILEVDGKKIEIPTIIKNENNIGATGKTPIQTKIGDSPPIINLPNNKLPDGTPATFTPDGASTSIKGIIKNNQFVPDPGQTIPVGSTPGLAVGTIRTANSSTGVLVDIQSTPELIKNVPFVRTGGAARN